MAPNVDDPSCKPDEPPFETVAARIAKASRLSQSMRESFEAWKGVPPPDPGKAAFNPEFILDRWASLVCTFDASGADPNKTHVPAVMIAIGEAVVARLSAIRHQLQEVAEAANRCSMSLDRLDSGVRAAVKEIAKVRVPKAAKQRR